MDPDQREQIFAASFLQVFPPSLKLFDAGQKPDFLHIVVDGMVELFTGNADRATTMAIIRPVRSFILAAAYTDQPYLMSARTLTASRILMTPSPLIRDAIDNDRELMRGAMHELAFGFRYFVRALSDMKLESTFLTLFLKGTVHTDTDRIDLKGQAVPLRKVGQLTEIVPLVGKLVSQAQREFVGVPFSLRGTLSNPNVGILPF